MLTRFKVRTNLKMYTVVVQYSDDHETFELDVFDGEPHFLDGTRKYVNEAEWIGGYKDEEFTHVMKPVELAKKVIETWERPKRLEDYLRLKRHVIELKEIGKDSAQETPSRSRKAEPVVYDYRDRLEADHIKYLRENPEALDQMTKKERDKWLKSDVELRLRYYEAKALARSTGKDGEGE
jgi:hypothetical protein